MFANIEDAARQTKATGNYTPAKKDEAKVVRSAKTGKTLRVLLSDLDLREKNDERCYFEIDTGCYDSLNPSRRSASSSCSS